MRSALPDWVIQRGEEARGQRPLRRASNNGKGLRDHCALQKTSEVRNSLRIELSDLEYPDIHVHIASNGHFGSLRGHGDLGGHNGPRRSHRTSNLNSVTLITYVTMPLWPLNTPINSIGTDRKPNAIH